MFCTSNLISIHLLSCRLYTQLEYLKNKTMRRDNPHISKRRGGRKQTHRRFSLQVSVCPPPYSSSLFLFRNLSLFHNNPQALSSRNRRPPPSQEVEVTEAEPSRTPEESVCSIEGPTDTCTGNEPSAYSSK